MKRFLIRLLSRVHPAAPRRPRATPARPRLEVEALERRDTPSGGPTLVNGVLTIPASPGEIVTVTEVHSPKTTSFLDEQVAVTYSNPAAAGNVLGTWYFALNASRVGGSGVSSITFIEPIFGDATFINSTNIPSQVVYPWFPPISV
jgi:hypothetical protein